MTAYFRPQTLKEALDLKAGQDLQVLAGGTDVYPIRTTREAWGDRTTRDVLDISGLLELRAIDKSSGRYRIGCLTTWSDLVKADLPPLFDGLKQAARDVGGMQIQNRGTIVGNICNASPAADGTPCLQAMKARVELTSARGMRTVDLTEFHDGYRSHVCRGDEIVTGLVFDEDDGDLSTGFRKLGSRRYLVISIVMAAGAIRTDAQGRVTMARISVGACSTVATRLTVLEETLKGVPLDQHISDLVDDYQLSSLQPIDDVRASASYRKEAARVVLKDLLDDFSMARLGRAA